MKRSVKYAVGCLFIVAGISLALGYARSFFSAAGLRSIFAPGFETYLVQTSRALQSFSKAVFIDPVFFAISSVFATGTIHVDGPLAFVAGIVLFFTGTGLMTTKVKFLALYTALAFIGIVVSLTLVSSVSRYWGVAWLVGTGGTLTIYVIYLTITTPPGHVHNWVNTGERTQIGSNSQGGMTGNVYQWKYVCTSCGAWKWA